MCGYSFQLDLKRGILRIGKEKIFMHRRKDTSVRTVVAKNTHIQNLSGLCGNIN